MKKNNNVCPICGYKIKECQCLYGHTSKRNKGRTVVLDHLYLLSKKQLKHIIDLQRFWQTSYVDVEKSNALINLEKEGTTILLGGSK